MKRQFFSLLMVMAVFSMYAEQPAAKPTEEEEREWLASSDGQHEDDATRSRKCASFWDVKTGTLTACSAVIRKNLDVQENLNVRGDATVCGNFNVKGDVIPRTIYLNENDNLNDVINELADCGQNYQPIILSLAPGDYAAGDLNVCNSIQDLTIQGDTSSLAGVGFMQGGFYNNPGLQLQCKIRNNEAIGSGGLYSVFRETGQTMMVTVTTDTNDNPDFSDVAAGTNVCFVDNNGVITAFEVASASGNTITFTADISGVDGLNQAADSDLGVGFVIKPTVTLTGGTNNHLQRVKNLKIRGVILDWSPATEPCDASQGLYLGDGSTKLELSNSIIQGVVRITARESYNCQPNTVLGANTPTVLVFGITSEPNFVFNSVFGATALVTAAGSKDGAFAYGQFSSSFLAVYQGAKLAIDKSRFYNVEGGALLVTDGSHVNWPGGVINGATSGVFIENSSGLTTNVLGCPDDPISIQNVTDTALTVTQNSFAIIRGVTNPEFFADNTIDLDVDGFTFADIDAYLSGAFGSAGSYLITN